MKLSLRQLMSRYSSKLIIFHHRLRGCEIGENCRISRSAILDRAHPKGVHIGDNTRVLMEALIIAHDYSRGALEGCSMWCDTRIGSNCVIGGRSMIMPGVSLNPGFFSIPFMFREITGMCVRFTFSRALLIKPT